MSEALPPPDPARFPSLEDDPHWIRTLAAGTLLARVFRAGGPYAAPWYAFREYGPLDARFDPQPPPPGETPGEGVLYCVLETPATPRTDAADSAFAACLLEVFQQHRVIRTSTNDPTLVTFSITKPARLLDLADSDWITVAGGNAAISSGSREDAREWARCIRKRYPEIDGILAPSSLVPTARTVTLWEPAKTKLPEHPTSILRLDRPELRSLIDRVADRYRFLLL